MNLNGMVAAMRCKCGAMIGNQLAQLETDVHLCECVTCKRKWHVLNMTKCEDDHWRLETCLEQTASE